jgi:hypothetical protein
MQQLDDLASSASASCYGVAVASFTVISFCHGRAPGSVSLSLLHYDATVLTFLLFSLISQITIIVRRKENPAYLRCEGMNAP